MATKRKPLPKVRADGNANPDPAPVELTNAVCPRCNGALHYSPARWLFCPRCAVMAKRGTNK